MCQIKKLYMYMYKMYFIQTTTLEKKKKNFALSRMFPFMRSKADRLECTGSDQDRKYS